MIGYAIAYAILACVMAGIALEVERNAGSPSILFVAVIGLFWPVILLLAVGGWLAGSLKRLKANAPKGKP